MRNVLHILTCLACAGHSWPGQNVRERTYSRSRKPVAAAHCSLSLAESDQSNASSRFTSACSTLKALAVLLLEMNAAAAFNPSSRANPGWSRGQKVVGRRDHTGFPALGARMSDDVTLVERDTSTTNTKVEDRVVSTLKVPDSMEELEATLSKHHIDPSVFGTGRAKDLDHLLKELCLGECRLQPLPLADGGAQLFRVVKIVSVKVRFGNAVLVEKSERLEDGRIRPRGNLLSEKLLATESRDTAVKRGLQEELGLKDGYTIVQGSWSNRVESNDSPSYPGLISEYHISAVDVTLDGTAATQGDLVGVGIQGGEMRNSTFETREPKGRDKFIHHQWIWVDDQDLSKHLRTPQDRQGAIGHISQDLRRSSSSS
mmetsp:Transcript_154113/g.284010  ORF Transcript_154113/g.284010 Transcript_154113/m.284010 type:complete len:372 (-) Transcript_154113:181-1296(-)